MRKLQTLLILCLLVAVLVAYRQLRQIENTAFEMVTPTAEKAAGASEAAPLDQVHSARKSAEFVKLVQKEAETISQLNDRPDEVQRRLKDLANQMRDADVEVLQKSALNASLNGDERFLSVYILGESSLAKAQESLEAIATSPIPKMQEARLTNQEEILRVQAVESLRQAESIKRVLAQTDNSFISDRAQRNLAYREKKVSSSPEQQDQAALTQLLNKSHQ
jgi:hypothetical protein